MATKLQIKIKTIYMIINLDPEYYRDHWNIDPIFHA